MSRGGARYDTAGKLLTGRKKAKERRKTSTITIWQRCWDELDSIGPSRGKAVEKLLERHKELK
jgi:hypothetical protein